MNDRKRGERFRSHKAQPPKVTFQTPITLSSRLSKNLFSRLLFQPFSTTKSVLFQCQITTLSTRLWTASPQLMNPWITLRRTKWTAGTTGIVAGPEKRIRLRRNLLTTAEGQAALVPRIA